MTETTPVALAAVTDTGRWQPTRAGLIGLWRYWDETFTFHGGRLLLRGPNGAGKSMALELLLPFLLDGDSSPSRLTSAAKSRGRLYDRLMTGTDDSSRTGFAWVEFRRSGGSSTDVFTVGARIRGSRATGKTDVDLFTTNLAVGDGLDLLDANRTPLSRKTLVEAIGATGRVHSSAEEHRAAVREVLFPHFGPDRYASVIGALLALRKEKLSQNLDLDKLSEVLSDALPPLDDQDIAAVAEGFERLDRRRAELTALDRDADQVRHLARRQRDYARAIVVDAAAHVRSAESARDTVTRDERTAQSELVATQASADGVAQELRSLDHRNRQVGVEIEALKDSDAYRDGAGLADLRSQATRLRAGAERAGEASEGAAAHHAEAVNDVATATEAARVAEANLSRASRDLGTAAEASGAHALVAEAEAVDDPDGGERLLHAWVGAQRERVADIRVALDAHSKAVAGRDFQEARVSDDSRDVDERTQARAAALKQEEAARTAYRTAITDWATASGALGADRLAAALPDPPDDPATVAGAVAAVAAEVQAEEAVARSGVASQRVVTGKERENLAAERARWEHGQLVDPDGPPWRSDRSGWSGAPLWRLVDVAPNASDADVDAIEAALTGAGLIDAWVTPDGRVDLDPDDADLLLAARPVDGRTLAGILAPVGGAAVAAPVVEAMLSSIRVVDSALDDPGGGTYGAGADVAIGADGTYRLGSALGRGPARPAILLGAVARERHRLARLADIDAQLAEVDTRLADLDRRDSALDRRRNAIEAELASRPSGDTVAAAGREVAAASARLEETRRRLDTARARLREAEDAVRSALRELTALAARHGLPADVDALTGVEAALGRFRDAASAWTRRRRDVQAGTRELDRATGQATTAERAAAKAAKNHTQADQEASDLEHRVATLESSVGAQYADTVRRITDLEAERRDNRQHTSELSKQDREFARALGELGVKAEAAAARRETVEQTREIVHSRLVATLDALADDAGVEIPGSLDTATGVLGAARAIATDLEQIDGGDQAVKKLDERVSEAVHAAQAALGSRVDFDRELTDEGWWVLRTTAGGLRRPAVKLAEALATELEEGRAELAADEEQLFEQTLAGSVRRALADRIRQATRLVDGINKQLAAVRTAAAGVQVRLRWDVDAEQPPAVKAARTLLLRDPADLADVERASLQAFVRARVDQARVELEANAPWEARLRETLDYRSWHRFTLQVAHRDWEGFQPATARRLQRLSTGERSIVLHVPMIASLAAHYADDDGQPSVCPRLILLDELFAGVDTANRAQLFGTFTTWQLDAIFTSDHEWCQYADLDAIAIHHLHPPTGDDPVTSTRFTWDGHRRRLDAPAA